MTDALILSAHPLEALLQLDKAARDGAPLVVVPADLRLDPNLKDTQGEHFDPRDHEAIDLRARQLITERRGEVRLIGPAGALTRGPGDIALVTMLGPTFPALASRLGDQLAVGIDLGLGWDMSAGEVLAWLAATTPRLRAVALALPPAGAPRPPELDPPSPWADLAAGLAAFARLGVPVFAVAAESAALAAHGVTVVPDLSALLERVTRRPGGLAVVSHLGAEGLIDSLIDTFELDLAELSEETLLALERELPRATRLGPHLKVPSPNARHLEVLRTTLAADPAVGRIWFTPDDPDPWATARRYAALRLAEREASPTELLDPDEARPRLVAELLGLRLMKRLTLDRDQVVSLLAQPAAPSWPVSSLAAALDAAQRVGYPVRLEPLSGGAPSRPPLNDREALTLAWEAELAALEAPGPVGIRGQDAWHARRVLPAREATRVRYTSHPLPLVHVDGLLLPLPARQHDIARHPTLGPLLAALTTVAAHHPEIATLEVEVDREGQLLNGSGTLLPLPAER